MRKIEPRAGQLVRWNPKKTGRYVQTAPFGLAKEAEGRVGKIYGLMTVDGPQRAGEALFAHVEDALGRGVLEALRKNRPDAPAEQVFESAVACVNRALSRLMGEQGIGLEPEYVSAALVAIQGNTMAAAIWGRPTLLLYRLTSSGGSRAFDLADDDAGTAPARRCFGSVISGPLGDRDRLLVASQDPRELVGEFELSTMMAASDPGTAAARIREYLSGIEDGPAIAVLTLDVAPVHYLEDSRRAVSTESSLAHLHGLESRTAETLAPSALSAIQKTFVDTATAAGGKLSTFGKKSPDDARAQAQGAGAVPRQPANRGALLRALIRGFKHAVAALWRVSVSLIKMILSGRWKSIPSAVAAKSDALAIGTIDRYNALPTPRRKILFAALATVLALNTSVLALSWKVRIGDFAAAGERRVLEISQKIDSAEASMIYRDEERAKAILVDAETDIAALPERSEKARAAKAALAGRIAEARDGMRRAVRLADPEPVSDPAIVGLAKLASEKAADAAEWNGRVYELIPAENRIVRHAKGAPADAAPQFYIKDATDVSRGVSMAIDGEVWVLAADGVITRFLRGVRADFQAAPVEPAMTAARRIRTSPESGYLHVLDSGRIVRFDKKSGALVAQYEHAYLAGATDLAIAADGKSALVTAGDRVLRFVLPE